MVATDPMTGAKAMEFFLFKDTTGDIDVAINPNLVRYVRPAAEGRVLIVFEKEHTLTVEGQIDDVISRLRTPQLKNSNVGT